MKIIDKIKEFCAEHPTQEKATFESWSAVCTCINGDKFFYVYPYWVRTDIISCDAIDWMLTQIKKDGYYRVENKNYYVQNIIFTQWTKMETIQGFVSCDDYRVDYSKKDIEEISQKTLDKQKQA